MRNEPYALVSFRLGRLFDDFKRLAAAARCGKIPVELRPVPDIDYRTVVYPVIFRHGEIFIDQVLGGLLHEV